MTTVATFPNRRADQRQWLQECYAEFNRRSLLSPDPLETVYDFADPKDQEIAALIAASLAYGRAAQIVSNVHRVLHIMGPSPKDYLLTRTKPQIHRDVAGFRHRWTDAEELATSLIAIAKVLDLHGSIEAAFNKHHDPDSGTTLAGLRGLVSELGHTNSLFADPTKNSACKRWHLYLRWMVRNDEIDPGCWTAIDPATLIVPLDTHMHRIARALRLTRRKQADLKTALEVTRAYRRFCPEDPLRYDFVLTRFGIRNDMELKPQSKTT